MKAAWSSDTLVSYCITTQKITTRIIGLSLCAILLSLHCVTVLGSYVHMGWQTKWI